MHVHVYKCLGVAILIELAYDYNTLQRFEVDGCVLRLRGQCPGCTLFKLHLPGYSSGHLDSKCISSWIGSCKMTKYFVIFLCELWLQLLLLMGFLNAIISETASGSLA